LRGVGGGINFCAILRVQRIWKIKEEGRKREKEKNIKEEEKRVLGMYIAKKTCKEKKLGKLRVA
jgi:hypothetical protein